MKSTYRQTYDISRISVGNRIVDHSDVVGAAPTEQVMLQPQQPTTYSFST